MHGRPGFHGGGISRSVAAPDTRFEGVMRFAGGGGEAPKPAKHFEGPWGDRASVARQMLEFPNTWRYKGAEQYKVFRLPDQEAEINEFLKPTHPLDSPARKIINRTARDVEGGVLIVLRYIDIEYMQLTVPVEKKEPPASLPPRGKLP